MANAVERIDLTDFKGRAFVVGDIHGMFTLLEEELATLNFNKDTDLLFSVGDLVDRGPESARAVDFAQLPWFKFVRGNHEDMTLTDGGRMWHVNNGGGWFNNLDFDDQIDAKRILNDAPVVIEITTPSGEKIGIVHADFPYDEWNDLDKIEGNQAAIKYCLWNRSTIEGALRRQQDGADTSQFRVANVDRIFMGHTPLKEPVTIENLSWIDTGACFNGCNLTIVQII